VDRSSESWRATEEDENQIKQPHAGQGASPGGHDGSMQISAPHTLQCPKLPSGVRDAMFVFRPLRLNELAQPTRTPSTWKV
jgi:hypothetical protein